MSKKQLNKPARRVSLKDHLAEKGLSKEKASPEQTVQLTNNLFDEESNQKLIDYNANITTINSKYADLKPRFDVIVRAFVNPLEEVNGVLMPNTVPVRASTKSGPGIIGFMENQFPYSRKAIVVALPNEVTDLEVGDVVYLAETPVRAQAVGKGDDAIVMIPNKFVHPDEEYKYPVEQPLPTDPADENYGYLITKPYDIKIKL